MNRNINLINFIGFILFFVQGCIVPIAIPIQPTSIPTTAIKELTMPFLFDESLNPQIGDERLIQGNFYLDSSEVINSQLPPGYKFGLLLKGNLPTACHQPRLVITPLLEQKK